jgi:hypothetical protein
VISKVYVETTIVSYLVARPSRDLIVAAHQQLTQEWWDFSKSNYEVYISRLVLQEAAAGDAILASRRLELLENVPQLELNEESLSLARTLISRGAIPSTVPEDALHVSIATVHGMDYLLTWNCKHIANAHIQRFIGTVCRESGYEPPVLCTPEELIGV